MSQLWQELGKILGFLAIGAGIWGLEKFRQWLQKRKEEKKAYAFHRAAEMDQQVQARLIELRTKLESGRVYVLLYHNGEEFSNENPIWRYTCTHETCAPGITHEMGELQSRLFSEISTAVQHVWDLDEALPSPDQDEETPEYFESGIGAALFLPSHKVSGDFERKLRATRYVSVEGMQESYWKSSLLSRGIWGYACTNLLKNGRPVGKIVANWLDEDWRDSDNCPEVDLLIHMAYYAIQIEFLMNE